MAGIDWFVYLTPVLVLAVLTLLGLVGCDRVFGLHHSSPSGPGLNAQPGFPPPGTRSPAINLTIEPTGLPLTISRKTTGAFEVLTQLDGNATSFVDTTVTPGTTFTYQAEDTSGATSPEVSATPWNLFVTAVVQLDPTLRNDVQAVGMVIVVGANALTVTALGRFAVFGNTGPHTMLIVEAITQFQAASVSVNLAGAPSGSFVYAALPTPAVLSPNTKYYVLSTEQVGGDQWHNGQFTQVTTTDAAQLTGPVSEVNGALTESNPETNFLFGPVDFLYE